MKLSDTTIDILIQQCPKHDKVDMNKPTFQEIEEAIRTLASAGMLLNAEQTIAVNRVLQEMDQQDEEETCWQMEEDSLHQAEIQRSEKEARMIEKERLLSQGIV